MVCQSPPFVMLRSTLSTAIGYDLSQLYENEGDNAIRIFRLGRPRGRAVDALHIDCDQDIHDDVFSRATALDDDNWSVRLDSHLWTDRPINGY